MVPRSNRLRFIMMRHVSRISKNSSFLGLLLLAACCGAAIAYVDSRPSWDDTGVTAGAILLTSGVFAFLSPKQWWIWALATGIWVPVLAIAQSQNFGALLALAVGFVGAVLGATIRVGSSRQTAMNP